MKDTTDVIGQSHHLPFQGCQDVQNLGKQKNNLISQNGVHYETCRFISVLYRQKAWKPGRKTIAVSVQDPRARSDRLEQRSERGNARPAEVVSLACVHALSGAGARFRLTYLRETPCPLHWQPASAP